MKQAVLANLASFASERPPNLLPDSVYQTWRGRPAADLTPAAQVRPLACHKLRHAVRRWNQSHALIYTNPSVPRSKSRVMLDPVPVAHDRPGRSPRLIMKSRLHDHAPHRLPAQNPYIPRAL